MARLCDLYQELREKENAYFVVIPFESTKIIFIIIQSSDA